MLHGVAGVVWFRFRRGIHARVGGYLSVILLVGMLGGLAMGAVVTARRTQSSFPAFIASTNASDLTVIDLQGANGVSDQTESSSFQATLAGLPQVKRLASWGTPNVLELQPDGTPVPPGPTPDTAGVFGAVSPNGLFTDQDRVTVVHGRMSDPSRADEVVATAAAARIYGLRMNESISVGFYSDQAARSAGYGTASVPPAFRLDVTLVGIVVFNNAVVQDDIDQLPTFVLYSPAVASRLAQCCGDRTGPFYGIQLVHGTGDVPAVESEIAAALPAAQVSSITAVQVAKAERAIEPESIALGVFGGIAALAALLIGVQVIARQLRSGAREADVMRALGASPMMTADGLIGVAAAVVVGAAIAAGVAVALSSLAPLGPTRAVDRSTGVAVDWTVIGVGVAVLISVLIGVAGMFAYRGATNRGPRRTQQLVGGTSRLSRMAIAAGLPPSAVAGISFAVEPSRDNGAPPVRSAMFGGALAVVIVIATVIFGASLHTLVSQPPLYGWNWDDELRSAYSGISNIPASNAEALLNSDTDVAAWTGVYFAAVQMDGVTVPVMGLDQTRSLGPSMLSGRDARAPDEVVLGSTTLSQLHKRVGDTVDESIEGGPTTKMTIVGTAALPAVGIALTLHMELSTGAAISQTLLPDTARGLGEHDGPEAYFVRFRAGIDLQAAHRRLDSVAAGMNTNPNDGPVTVLGVQRPAEIVNYRTMGATPVLLAAALATGAAAALALTLVASVRRRRRDLAVLNTLGFTHRQVAAVVAWESSLAAVFGAVVGVPVGIVTGRWLWTRFAKGIQVVPRPTVPGFTIVLIAIGVLLLANLAAAIPGRRAARTPTALLLRAD